MSTVYATARVTTIANIRREHRLPRGSVPRVLIGQTVKATDPLAVVEIAAEHRIINLAERLRLNPQRIDPYLVKRTGDPVEEGDILATRRGFLGLRKLRVLSPMAGQVIQVENGQMLLEGPRVRSEVLASIPGKVVALEPEEYVIIETPGAAIRMAWGHGPFTWGTLKVLDEQPSLTAEVDRFSIDHRGAIVAIGSPLTADFLKAAADIRVKGLIAASMHASLVSQLADIDFPVMLTQGFGHLPMSERVLNLINTYNGREIALDTGMVGDWRERRPEIIIPLTSQQQASLPEEGASDIKIVTGQRVRILQPPYLGEIGTVVAISEDPRQLESGLWASGITVEMPSGARVFVPFANFEYLG